MGRSDIIKRLKKEGTVESLVKPRRRFAKPLLYFAGILFLILISIGFYALAQTRKIFESNSNFLSFLGDISQSRLKGEVDGRVNILLLGVGGAKHPGGSLADTIQLVSVNTAKNQAAIVSIPRDLGVTISGVGFNKINYAHAYGEQNPKQTSGGGALMKKTVSQILDLPIHYYARLDFNGFEKLVDALGGVTVNVEKPLNDSFFPAPNMVDYEPFSLKAGIQKLNGKTALKYARSRETTSDFDRSRRQQQVLKAMAERATSLGILANPAKIVGIVKIIGEHFRTDLTVTELEKLIKVVKKIDRDGLKTKVLDTSAEGFLVSSSNGNGYYLAPKAGNFKEIQVMVKNIFDEPASASKP
ncbi:LCP family protein [Candidatus Berkelbacteria bacterium]|nr:LCP family protein [Candidatus Berkelbacteria bacterium]MBI2588428.1 LCP family protein [Candidatus Berkelbacteria bacterium]MBI4030008.1 LCP family protein [Candidatus Berkelbacteria bacterium]